MSNLEIFEDYLTFVCENYSDSIELNPFEIKKLRKEKEEKLRKLRKERYKARQKFLWYL